MKTKQEILTKMDKQELEKAISDILYAMANEEMTYEQAHAEIMELLNPIIEDAWKYNDLKK